MNEPKTKIVATLGPASSSREVLRDMMLSGMDVCRLNFSHGSYDFYADVIATIRSLNEELGTFTAILADQRTQAAAGFGVVAEVGGPDPVDLDRVGP